MTPEQLQILNTEIDADGTLSSQPLTNDGAIVIRDAMNALASPEFTVWKTMVSIVNVGRAVNGGELAGLTTANHTRLQTIIQISGGTVNPSLADSRAFWNDVFSGAGGATTRTNLLALWKRLSTRAEKLYATGTGSDASPATLVFEGNISINDVQEARAL
jgi:hypothetical protein